MKGALLMKKVICLILAMLLISTTVCFAEENTQDRMYTVIYNRIARVSP